MKRYSGFSLVELSIVLVILGLLVGGILGGQALIKAAELRTIITDKDRFLVAMNSFRGKYNALPGDMPNAIDYWGAAHATPATCLATTRSGGTTCNGNGNGDITGVNTTSMETSLAWEHMSLAGLITGNYVGYYTGLGGGQWTFYPGTTSPLGRITGSAWYLFSATYLQSFANASTYNDWQGRYKHQLGFSSYSTAISNEYTGTGILAPEDAFAVDGKIDDGKPGTGTVRTQNYNTTAGNCTNSVTPSAYATATYALSSSGNYCKLYFDLGF